MSAQTVTNRMSAAQIQRLVNLKLEVEAAAGENIADNTTSTLTLVHTAATGAITLDYSST